MLRLHGLVGHQSNPDLRERLHALEHCDAIERVFLDTADVGRRRFRLTTDKGTDCAVSLDRNEELSDGAVLLLDQHRAILVRLGVPQTWRLRARDSAAALHLGWHAGNLHWRVRFEEADLVVLIDGPIPEYRARLQALINDGSVREVNAE